MNNVNREVESLTVRPVCLGDMATILEIYKGSLSANQEKAATPLIANDFGLPLTIILNGNTIVGYTFLKVGNTGDTELHYLFSSSEKFTKISDDLLRSSWDKTEPANQLTDSVSRLVKWLNDCY